MADLHAQLAGGLSYQKHLARFLENHDEDRCAAAFGPERLASVVTFMGTLPGMRFYQEGEIEGAKIHLPVALRRVVDEPPNQASAAVFEKILAMTKQDVFHKGHWSGLPIASDGEDTSGNLVAYEWRFENAWKVIVVNLTSGVAQGRISFGDRPLAEQEYMFHDELDDVRYPRSGDEIRRLGLFVRREAFQGHFFDVSSA